MSSYFHDIKSGPRFSGGTFGLWGRYFMKEAGITPQPHIFRYVQHTQSEGVLYGVDDLWFACKMECCGRIQDAYFMFFGSSEDWR